jgi:hypothetical protein
VCPLLQLGDEGGKGVVECGMWRDISDVRAEWRCVDDVQDYTMWVNDTIFGVKMWNKFWNLEGVCNGCESLVFFANTLARVEY